MRQTYIDVNTYRCNPLVTQLLLKLKIKKILNIINKFIQIGLIELFLTAAELLSDEIAIDDNARTVLLHIMQTSSNNDYFDILYYSKRYSILRNPHQMNVTRNWNKLYNENFIEQISLNSV